MVVSHTTLQSSPVSFDRGRDDFVSPTTFNKRAAKLLYLEIQLFYLEIQLCILNKSFNAIKKKNDFKEKEIVKGMGRNDFFQNTV